jgi:hypothetical protein
VDLLTITEIAAMLKTSEGIATQIMGDTPYLHLGAGKGKGRRYRRSDVMAVIQGRFVDPRPGKKLMAEDEFWRLPRKERLSLLRN